MRFLKPSLVGLDVRRGLSGIEQICLPEPVAALIDSVRIDNRSYVQVCRERKPRDVKSAGMIQVEPQLRAKISRDSALAAPYPDSSHMQAVDRRRFTAPEGSTALHFAPEDSPEPVASTSAVRLDGRQPTQVRPVCTCSTPGSDPSQEHPTDSRVRSLAGRTRDRGRRFSLHRGRTNKAPLRRVGHGGRRDTRKL